MSIEFRHDTTLPQQPIFDSSSPPQTVPHNEYGNRDIRGRATEEKVAYLLRALPHVSGVELTEKNGELDRKMTDLVVFFHPLEDGTEKEPVNVQVKSTSKEVRNFRWKKMRGIEGEEARQEWLKERRLILLNGDIKITRNNNRSFISDEEIIVDFTSQLSKLDDNS